MNKTIQVAILSHVCRKVPKLGRNLPNSMARNLTKPCNSGDLNGTLEEFRNLFIALFLSTHCSISIALVAGSLLHRYETDSHRPTLFWTLQQLPLFCCLCVSCPKYKGLVPFW